MGTHITLFLCWQYYLTVHGWILRTSYRQITALRNHWIRGFWKAETMSDPFLYPIPGAVWAHNILLSLMRRDSPGSACDHPTNFCTCPVHPPPHPYPGRCYSYSSEQLAPGYGMKHGSPPLFPSLSLCSQLPSSYEPCWVLPDPLPISGLFPAASHHSGPRVGGHKHLCPKPLSF